MTKKYTTTFDHTRFPNLASKYYSDTIFIKIKLIRSSSCDQVFSDSKGDTNLYPLRHKNQLEGSLMYFINDAGVPKDLVTKKSKEETLGEWQETPNKFHIKHHVTELISQ